MPRQACFAPPVMVGTVGTQLRLSRAIAAARCVGWAPSAAFSERNQLNRLCTAVHRYALPAEEEHTVGITEICDVQRTLARGVTRSGVGLHSGETALLRLLPAAAGEGRYFVCQGDGAHPQKDGQQDVEYSRVPAFVEYVKETRLSTCIGNGHARVRTVEHLLSALEGMGVDNCRIEIQGGEEVPLLDGSAQNWVEAIQEAGLSMAEDGSQSPSSRKAVVVEMPIVVQNGDAFVAAFPAPSTRLTYGIDFPQAPAIGRQWFTWCPSDPPGYHLEVAPARTFGIYEQITQLRAAGLIKGGSLDNALVCSMEGGWLNPPLRFPDEPCRHKLLDLVGDLALCAKNGHPGLPIAHIVAFKASHQLHVQFVRALLLRGEVSRSYPDPGALTTTLGLK